MRSKTMSTLARPALAALCAVMALGLASPALAQGKKPGKAGAVKAPPAPKPLSETLTGDAKAEYEAGKILYQDGDHTNALLKFQHAYTLANDARLLWNVAACEKNLRHYTKVLAAVEKYQKEGGDQLTDQDRQDAADLVKTVRTLVSTVQIAVDEPGADVFVDDEKIGTSPLPGPVLVDVGNRKVRVVKPGFKESVRLEPVAGATEVKVSVKLEKEIHQGKLIVEAGPKDVIFLDGKAVGTARWEGVLPSGGHALRVTGQGMIPYQSEVTIQDDKQRRVPITLEAAKGGISTAWLWAGGGTLVAAAGVVTAVLLIKPPKNDPAPGTIAPGVVPVAMGGFHFGGGR
jgi:PEGA domain